MDLSPFDAGEPVDPFEVFLVDLAKAADLCLKPYRHALRFSGEAPTTIGECSENWRSTAAATIST